MQLVEQAVHLPGICCLTGTSSGPFLQLDRLLDPALAEGGVAYVSVQAVEALASQIGLVRATTHVEETIARLTAERDQARDEHHELLQAIGTTLKYGAIVKRGAIELRKPYDRTGRLINHKQGKRKGVSA